MAKDAMRVSNGLAISPEGWRVSKDGRAGGFIPRPPKAVQRQDRSHARFRTPTSGAGLTNLLNN